MPELDDIRRSRGELESRKLTIAARIAAEERSLAEARRVADARLARSAESRLKSLRVEAKVAVTRLHTTEARLATLLSETVTRPPETTPASEEAPLDLLGPVPADVPLVLLPVRLEVRFRGSAPNRELLVRVFPDDIHVDTHEPGLTDEELDAGKAYWKQAWSGQEAADKAAWHQLAGMFGAERAAWIARVLTPTNLRERGGSAPAFPEVSGRPSSWTRAPRTTVLPDRWIALGHVGAQRVFAVAGNPLPDSLPVGPEPGDEEEAPTPDDGPVDAGMRWLVDFEAAVNVGMGLRIPLPAAAQDGLSRLVVFGVKRSRGAAESETALRELLDAHHYTRGLSMIVPGTPTNNTTHTTSGLDSRDPGHERSFACERGAPLFKERSAADGAVAARGLGIAAEALQHLAEADGTRLQMARAMNTVLWPATWDYYLEQRLAGVVTDAELRRIRQHFVDFVRAGGPLPALRIGRQPYGWLPAASLDRWQGAGEDEPGPRATAVLRDVREAFRRALSRVPRILNADTSDQDLLSVLRMRPHARGHRIRHVLGPLFVANFYGFTGAGLSQAWWTAHRDVVRPPNLGGITPTTPQSLATLAPHTEALKDAPCVTAGDAKPDYLTRLANSGYKAALQQENVPPDPVPFLYQLARHALLVAYAQAAHRIWIRAGVEPAGSHLEPELIGMDANASADTLWTRLEQPVAGVTGQRSLGVFLDDKKQEKDPDIRELGELRAALRELARAEPAELERACLETLDLAAHRLDAWITSLATSRLESLRKQGAAGVQIGGYGWLEGLQPASEPVSNGFLQVPSLEHAACAAILASGYLTHRNTDAPSPFALDLASERVRLARWILQGVRAGQSLGALLGYRIERALHEARLTRHVDEIRKLYAAPSGVDGLRLLEDMRGRTGDFGKLTGAIKTDMGMVTNVLSAVDQELDALGDLLIAEGVFQATRGNFERAGQTLSAVINGQALPEPEVMDTPRTGVVVSHRVMTFLPVKGAAPARLVENTPRARAEPRLNRWLGGLLGDLKQVRCRVAYVMPERTVERVLALAELGLAPLDLVVATAENLEALVLEQAKKKRPARVPAEVDVQLVRERDPKWPRDVIGWNDFVALAAALRRMLASARAALGSDLAPPDRRDSSTVDIAELRKRADQAVAELQRAIEARDSAEALRVFGIFATPAGAAAEARERLSRARRAEEALRRDQATPARLIEHDAERIRLVFGSTFPVLPLFKATNLGELTETFAASQSLQRDDPLAAVTWLGRVAHVRPRLAAWEDAARLLSVLHGAEEECHVGQLPFVEDDTWVALPPAAGSHASGKLGVVVVGDVPDLATATCGLVLDEWSEMIPGARETTGLVFQFDRPASRPPQACLLAVAPDPARPWDMDTLEAVVVETLELAQLRLVDQDALTELDHYLPALQFALNVPGDTVTTDFR